MTRASMYLLAPLLCWKARPSCRPLTGQKAWEPRRGCLMLRRASPVRRDPLGQCGQETSLKGKVKLFSADRGHHFPAVEGGMSGLPCLVCVSLLYLVVGLVGWSWCPVAPGAVAVFSCVSMCFSVTSGAALDPRTGNFGQVHPAAALPDGCLVTSMLWGFGSLCQEASRRIPRWLFRQQLDIFPSDL